MADSGFDPTLMAYDLAVLAPDGRIMHLPRGGLTVEESPSELATVMRCRLPDMWTTEGHMAELVQPGTRYYVSVSERGPVGGALRTPAMSTGAAWDPEKGGTIGGIVRGDKPQEITRGIIHRISRRADSAEIEIEGSDQLHSLLEHDIDLHVTAGEQAQAVFERLFSGWGASLGEYAGPHCELPEKTFRGERAAKVIDELLSYGPRQGAGQFLLRAQGDQFNVVAAGGNQPTYWLRAGEGAGVSSYTIDISNIVANVIVHTEIGDADDEDGPPIVLDTSAEGTSEYGGATRIIVRDEKTTQAISQMEAQAELAKHGFPDQTFAHTTFDVPYLHKFDRLRISDRLLDGYFIVAGVAHDASQMQMQVNLITPEDFERKALQITLEAQLDALKNEQQQLRKDQSPSTRKKLDEREFNRNAPNVVQVNDWTCSAASLATLLAMCHVTGATEMGMVEELGSGISSGVGLHDASGTQLIRILKEHGISGSSQPLASSQFEQALSIFGPGGAVGMMSGGAWYHWTAVRGATAEGLMLGNPAPGYKGVDQVMRRSDFERLGPWSLVVVKRLPKKKDDESGEDASGWEMLP